MFLVLTGLPWAGLWGDLLTRAANNVGAGYPVGLWDDVPSSGLPTKAVIDGGPWTLEGALMPASTPPTGSHAGHGGDAAGGQPAPAATAKPIGVDAVAAIAEEHGLTGGYRLHLPEGAEGVYTVSHFPDRPEGQVTLHVDQYSGKVLAEYRFDQYGIVAKPVEWGIALHMGNYFGLLNQLLMLSIAAMIVVLAVTGTVMWWCRRPLGRLGAPPAVDGLRLRGVAAIIAALGVIFPLVGASLVAVLALDQLVLRRVPRLRRAFA